MSKSSFSEVVPFENISNKDPTSPTRGHGDDVMDFYNEQDDYPKPRRRMSSIGDTNDPSAVKVYNKILGVDEEEMKRNKALVHLGVSNDDAINAHKLMQSIPLPSNRKEERITGYTLSQMKRIKAINTLGASEEAIADETSKALAALGIGHNVNSLHSGFHFLSSLSPLSPGSNSSAQENKIRKMMQNNHAFNSKELIEEAQLKKREQQAKTNATSFSNLENKDIA
mmetsp:Transcript_23507/g.23714  ORF Transcript_23507/g.23714 Transcript_23507/m.23714 type:complete len:226 (-) Transcript_23507:193-870(-)|eukprot:CAMPEP_0182428770 /NCGR_PEP_ID=MMETSP1167-20130531/23501_1 /TAXON_ID=2988 /ORGANISM="Mallomonas Sp, Strain CCMP3275" /LENGTH=225 /DNA_ID=CAMNT_0024611857 /DNA_START=103 /DNA_END=780 /DNA_ORIENTATION=-